MKVLVRTYAVLLLALATYGLQADRDANSVKIKLKEPSQRPTAILKEPVVLGAGDTWAVISWTTNAGGKDRSKIYAGRDKANLAAVDQTVTDTTQEGPVESYQEQEYPHLVRLNNLKPGTNYYFQADSGSLSDHGPDSKSSVWQFRTSGVAPENVAVARAHSRRASTIKVAAKRKTKSKPVKVASLNQSEAASLK